jgi:hypothetical protein
MQAADSYFTATGAYEHARRRTKGAACVRGVWLVGIYSYAGLAGYWRPELPSSTAVLEPAADPWASELPGGGRAAVPGASAWTGC